jgi:outer membrane protein assembly factor BamD
MNKNDNFANSKVCMLRNILFFLSSFVVVACSGFNAVLRGDDFELKRTCANDAYSRRNWDRSAALYEQIYQRYSTGPIGEEAYFRLGMSHYNMEDYILAKYYFENFATRFFLSNLAEEAKFLAAICAVKNVPKKSLDQAETYQAMQSLQEFVNQYPNSQLVDSCNRVMDRLSLQLENKAWDNAYLYYHMEQYRAAAAAMDIFVEDFPSTKRKEDALYIAARSSYFLALNSVESKKNERYEALLERCITFARLFPESKYTNEIQNYRKRAEAVVSLTKND